jgi:DNA adenine methylase
VPYPTSREVFKWLQDAPPATLTEIQRAARMFYLQHHAFGGKVSGQTWGTATTAPPSICCASRSSSARPI